MPKKRKRLFLQPNAAEFKHRGNKIKMYFHDNEAVTLAINDQWVPGIFDCEDTALEAIDNLDDKTIAFMQQQSGLITMKQVLAG